MLSLSVPALHPGGGAEKGAAPRPGRVLHHEDASLQVPGGATGGARLHCLLHCALWGERPLTPPPSTLLGCSSWVDSSYLWMIYFLFKMGDEFVIGNLLVVSAMDMCCLVVDNHDAHYEIVLVSFLIHIAP